ncbi:integral memnbrane protein [Campylobacter sp. MIT 21-1685]|uniref:integral memnbrane protein n=1 Tax=unclassified Campylobacter TaxID=2593542 RepID=UPI00224AC778|nr:MULTISPECIES: integral memnbrane protein [unclassified Campylobacter]MCX2682911.1 integral memnbrane protein [Campylobacter sp. MIT 21-1684]MCX2751141.1 integral memnbrane protein [Campylobacter sp. MIT 21-1682]MCX2807392.1 integral memnbrane protein [Campylobacter sp. MIT 21-1685]
MRYTFIAFFIFELFTCTFFIIFFGFGNFLFFILASMFIGIILLGIFWKNMLEFHIDGLKNMLEQFSFVLAGFLFLVPGIISSIFAVFILLFAFFVQTLMKNKARHSKNKDTMNDEIIDVEIIEDKK